MYKAVCNRKRSRRKYAVCAVPMLNERLKVLMLCTQLIMCDPCANSDFALTSQALPCRCRVTGCWTDQ
eukprot:1159640-Pelagomonas_calceolata.AAC.7